MQDSEEEDNNDDDEVQEKESSMSPAVDTEGTSSSHVKVPAQKRSPSPEQFKTEEEKQAELVRFLITRMQKIS